MIKSGGGGGGEREREREGEEKRAEIQSPVEKFGSLENEPETIFHVIRGG